MDRSAKYLAYLPMGSILQEHIRSFKGQNVTLIDTVKSIIYINILSPTDFKDYERSQFGHLCWTTFSAHFLKGQRINASASQPTHPTQHILLKLIVSRHPKQEFQSLNPYLVLEGTELPPSHDPSLHATSAILACS